jgi:hypothetical protein
MAAPIDYTVSLPSYPQYTTFQAVLSAISLLESAEDPAETPFQSKYLSRTLWAELQRHFEQKINDFEANSGQISRSEEQEITFSTLQILLLRSIYGLGLNFTNCEEIPSGEKLFYQALELARGVQLSGAVQGADFLLEMYLMSLIDSGNQLGIIWSNRSELAKAKEYLLGAQEKYLGCKERIKLDNDNLLRLHTQTLFYLAQIYSKLNRRELSAIYCHLCLIRQLNSRKTQESSENNAEQFNSVEFVQNCIGLSYYYTGLAQFQQAIHCLQAAKCFLPDQSFLSARNSTETKANSPNSSVSEGQLQLAADLSRAFGIFYLKQMKEAKKLRLEIDNKGSEEEEIPEAAEEDVEEGEEGKKEKNLPPNDLEKATIYTEKQYILDRSGSKPVQGHSNSTNNSNNGSNNDNQGKHSELLLFPGLDLPFPAPITVEATYSFASSAFKSTLLWLTRATNYYELNGFVSDHIPIVQDMSLAYKLLIFFENDSGRAAKMHKRRLDLLQPIMKDLSQAAYLEFYQQLSDEIAQIYTEMIGIKQKLQQQSNEPRRKAELQQKINELALKAIAVYDNWCSTWLEKGSTPQTPLFKKELNEEPVYQRYFLNAKFQIAHLFNKIYVDQAQTLLEFQRRALETFQFIIELAKKWENTLEKGALKGELDIANQMVELLPLKMSKIQAHGPFSVAASSSSDNI